MNILTIPSEQWFSALSHPARLRCLMLLRDNGELCVCELSHALSLSQPIVSRQMAILKEKRIVSDRRQGVWIFYQLHPDLPDWCRNILSSSGSALHFQSPFAEDSQRISLIADRKEAPCARLSVDGPFSTTPFHLLFVCTGNSCRSQMAEGWARALAFEGLSVRSAGTHPHPDGVNPLAVAVMRQAGIDISHQTSTRLDSELLSWARLVVTVCGEADETCPLLPPGTRKEHWPIPDPDKSRGSSRQMFETFCRSRDEIQERVLALLDRIRPISKEQPLHPPGTLTFPSR
ncbi:MAG: metalloregulator ArsR/SmtB family transcription factor [Leptospirales bacterium]